MKIFVTGITSFLGKSFLPKILNRLSTGDEIFLLVRRKINCEDKRVQQLIGTLQEVDKFEKILLESNYVYHIAANAVFGSNDNYFEVNYEPTKKMVNILEKSTNLKNFIYISTIGAFDRHRTDNCSNPIKRTSKPSPKSDYGKSKLESEKYIINSKIPYTIIRPAWIYGKNMRANSHINQFVNLVIERNPIMYLAFKGKVSVIHVDDLATALVNVIDNEKVLYRTYFAVTESVSIGDIFKLIYEKIYSEKLFQLRIPRFSFIISRIHQILPVSIANLFLDYLCADPEEFWEDFSIFEKKTISEGITDVINSNAKLNGYYVITGANSGIGFALAKLLNKQKKKLILIDKEIDRVKELNFNSNKIIKCDLTEFVNNTDLLNEIENELIYCLINNAGIGLKGSLDTLEEEKIKQIVYVNSLAPVLLTRKIINNLIRNQGVIVNIISSIAFNPLPYMSLYSATKSFLKSWSESITYELRKTNLVITFAPSGTLTNFQKNAGVKVLNQGKGLLSPDYVATKIIEAIQKKKKFVVLGFSTKILLAISKFLPTKLNISLWGKLFEKFR